MNILLRHNFYFKNKNLKKQKNNNLKKQKLNHFDCNLHLSNIII